MAHSGLMPLDLAISFDTTGSMSSVIGEVRTNIATMLERLCADIPDIRVAVIAHGDYGDRYETEIRDFGTSTADLVTFIKTVAMTGGSDEPECYELVLQQARTRLTWRRSSSRALVLVGDSFPHEVGSARNKYKIDWKAELELLRQLGITGYCVQCRSNSLQTQQFMDEVAKVTGGLRLPLAEFRGVRDFLMAIAYREGGTDVLQDVYEREVRAREGPALAGDVSAMFGLVRHASATRDAGPTRSTAASAVTKTAARPRKMTKAAAVARVKKVLTKVPNAVTKRPKRIGARKAAAVRIRRETCSGKNLPASLASLAWSTWRLVGRPGSHGESRSSWQTLGSGSVRQSLFPLLRRGELGVGPQAVELAVQPRPGARRFPLFGRVLCLGTGSSATLGRLLSGRPGVRAQLLRVLRQGMRVYARVANASTVSGAGTGLKLRPGLMKAASYAWNSGRSVRCSGVFVSVSEKSLS